MEKKEIIIFGLKVNYLISPNFNPDQAVVFSPGWKSPVNLFCSVMGDMPNLLAINFPGWPDSEVPRATWGLVEYADFLQKFLEKLQVKPKILIGHSVGAAIAVEYLSRTGQSQSDQIEKLIIIDGAIIREKSRRSQALLVAAKVFRFCFPFVNKDQRRRLAGNFLSPDCVQAGEMEEIYKRLISEDRQASWQSLTLPTMMIWGENDQDTPLEQAKRLHEQRPQASLEVISGAGHYCFLDKPREFKDIITKFL
jgi:pimeloyl-ACP methyl ester carboxylesterase